MSKARFIQDYLNDILEAVADIKDFTKGMDYEAFVSDRKTRAATIRNMEIVGEAVGKIPIEIRNQYAEVPWGDICGIRNKLAHEYFGVNYAIVWQTIEDDLTPLTNTVLKILSELADKDVSLNRQHPSI